MLRTQIVLDMADPGDTVRAILGAALVAKRFDRTGQRNLPVLYGKIDVGGIKVGIISEHIVKILLDADIRTAVSLGPDAGEIGFPPTERVVVAQP